MSDLLFEDITLIDGSGAPARRATVEVRDGRVTSVRDTAAAADLSGEVLCPGFIDLHSHADFTVEGSPAASTQLAQGVTTLITGNCGLSPFPLSELSRERRAGGFVSPGMSWQWSDLVGYADAIDRVRPGVNLGLQVGHGALRAAVLGEDDRPPSADELAAMCDLLREAADQGAVGFSTGLIYAPSSYAAPEEIQALAAVVAERGLLYSTHMHNETDQVLESVDEAIETARRTGVRLEISHIKAMGGRNHGKVPRILERIEAARAEGLDVAGDVYPYTASSTTLNSRLPGWALDGGVDALLERLADPRVRARVREALADRFSGEIDPGGIVLAALPDGPFSDRIGRSLVDLAEEAGTDPADVALDALAGHAGRVQIINHAMDPADLDAAIAHPWVSVASDGSLLDPHGDGLPHPRSFGTFARVLAHFVRQRRLIGLEEAIRTMTSLPASRLGWGDRGVVRAGAVADLVTLRPDSVQDRSTYADPWRLAEGVTATFVAGERAWAGPQNAQDAPRAGRVLRNR